MVAHCDVGTPTEFVSRRLPELRVFLGDVFFATRRLIRKRVLRARRLSTRAGKLHFGMNDECDAERVP